MKYVVGIDLGTTNTVVAFAPISATLPAEGRGAGDMVPVKLHARTTEAGTLEVEAVARGGGERWKVEFDMRGEGQEQAATT